MKQFVAMLTLMIGSTVSVYAARPIAPPKVRVSAPHDHAPKTRTKSVTPHK